MKISSPLTETRSELPSPEGSPDLHTVSYGGWLSAPSRTALDAFATAGFDYVGIDTQHSTIGEDMAQQLLESLRHHRTPTMVRVACNDGAKIGRMLDSGADAVIVPMIETKGQTETAVRACRFPPFGTRSFGPIRRDLHGLSIRELDDRARCFVQIETAEGIRNAESIIATEGLDGVYVGPSDLSISFGLDPIEGFTTDQLGEHYATLRRLCERYGVTLGTHAIDVDSTRRFREWGVTLISVINDNQLLQQAARDTVAEVHRECPTGSSATADASEKERKGSYL